MLVAWWLLAAYAHSAQERFALWAVELLHAARALLRRNLAAIRLNLNSRHVELQKEMCINVRNRVAELFNPNSYGVHLLGSNPPLAIGMRDLKNNEAGPGLT